MNSYKFMNPMYKIFRKVISFTLITAFIGSSLYLPKAQAGEMVVPFMPKPGTMVNLSPEYTPAYLKGIVIHPDNALKFDFLVHKGNGNLDDAQKRQEYNKLIKYFLASLTVPEKDQWVNLSPYEKNRIIKDDFGKTEMGRDLLEQDYLLKQITASLMYPESGLGKVFWDRVYERAHQEFGTTDIPVNTFNKVWIVPDEALIYESGNTAYVVKSHLKVMLEEDYLSLKKHTAIENPDPKQNALHSVSSKVIKEIILPEIEREVNEGKNFAMLRQVFSGMVLATWYKKALKESLLGKVYADKAKVLGVNQNPKNNDVIYHKYLAAFKKGVYNYIKEDTDKYTNEVIPRKYFAGGFDPAVTAAEHMVPVSIEKLDAVITADGIDTIDAATVAIDQAQASTEAPNWVDRAMINVDNIRPQSFMRTEDSRHSKDRNIIARIDVKDVNGRTVPNGKGILAAVLDGHTEDFRLAPLVATFIENRFLGIFESQLKVQNGDVKQAIMATFEAIHRLIKENSKGLSAGRNGASMAGFYLSQEDQNAYTFAIGDSVVIGENKNNTVWSLGHQNYTLSQREKTRIDRTITRLGNEHFEIGKKGMHIKYVSGVSGVSDYGVQVTGGFGDLLLEGVLDRRGRVSKPIHLAGIKSLHVSSDWFIPEIAKPYADDILPTVVANMFFEKVGRNDETLAGSISKAIDDATVLRVNIDQAMAAPVVKGKPDRAMNTSKESTLEEELIKDLPPLIKIVNGRLNPQPSFYGDIVTKWKRIIWNHKGADLDDITRESSIAILNNLGFNRKEFPMLNAQQLIDFYYRFIDEIQGLNEHLDNIESAANEFGKQFDLTQPQIGLITDYFIGNLTFELLETKLIEEGLPKLKANGIADIASERKKELNSAMVTRYNWHLGPQDVSLPDQLRIAQGKRTVYESEQGILPRRFLTRTGLNEDRIMLELKRNGYFSAEGKVEKIGPLSFNFKRDLNHALPEYGDHEFKQIEKMLLDNARSGLKNPAMVGQPTNLGGIDLNAANLAMVIRRDGKGVPLPIAQQDLSQLARISGFVPRILEIKPVSSLPIFSDAK